jgi:polyhydroxybutyrate depolymerase
MPRTVLRMSFTPRVLRGLVGGLGLSSLLLLTACGGEIDSDADVGTEGAGANVPTGNTATAQGMPSSGPAGVEPPSSTQMEPSGNTLSEPMAMPGPPPSTMADDTSTTEAAGETRDGETATGDPGGGAAADPSDDSPLGDPSGAGAPMGLPMGMPMGMGMGGGSPMPGMDDGNQPAAMEPAVTERESGPSAGCGTQTSLTNGRATIDVDGAQREYILQIPSGYDSSQPHKLVFGLHWRGGQASDVATGGTIGMGNYYGLEQAAQGSTIFVAPEGIDNGWANTGGRDIALMKAILDLFKSELCIDMDRIFSLGFSFGGMMSFAIACEMADVFRAVAPMSGALYSGCGNGTEPIAMWGAHGTADDVVNINDGRQGLQEVLDRNHCSDQTMPTDPSPCVSYQGCDEGYPVTWCETEGGGHSPAGWMTAPIWEFFSQF